MMVVILPGLSDQMILPEAEMLVRSPRVRVKVYRRPKDGYRQPAPVGAESLAVPALVRLCAAPGCSTPALALVKRRGGGTRNRLYCCFECQQRAYRRRKREAALAALGNKGAGRGQ
jgi:hypothetical protein